MHFKDFKWIFHYQHTPALVIYFSILTSMVTKVVWKEEISSAGLRSMKTEKYRILEKHVKTANFKQNWILRYYKEQKYIKLIVAIV